jgi:hypothetical protein
VLNFNSIKNSDILPIKYLFLFKIYLNVNYFDFIASNGNVYMYKWFSDTGIRLIPKKLGSMIATVNGFNSAAENGHLEMVIHLHNMCQVCAMDEMDI